MQAAAWIIAAAAAVIAGFCLVLLLRQSRGQAAMEQEIARRVHDELASYGDSLWRAAQEASDRQNERLENVDRGMKHLSLLTEQRLDNLRTASMRQLGSMESSVNEQMKQMREENDRRLDQMRATVDEKLQQTLDRRISESFETVHQSLDQVSRGLGEMRQLARGVGDLKKVLTNVKTRGNLGEIQLGAILEEILAPEQYARNVNTRGEGAEFVEFAVKMPGENGKPVWLPIDSKFPADSYVRLQDAYDSGDPDQVARARKQLTAVLKKEARDIQTKYLAPPATTDFGILFLPSEGLYAEAIRLGMVETLQRDYHVTIAGPTTTAALLNSLQTGFRTLAIQERSAEVWETLAQVRTEFDKFEDVLKKTQDNLTRANANLDQLVGVRTRAMRRKLERVTEFESEGGQSPHARESLADAPNPGAPADPME